MRETNEPARMDFSFNARSLRTLLHSAVADHISELTRAAADNSSEETPEQLLAGLEKAIDVMERIEYATGHQNRDLIRLSIPIVLWVARNGGQINRLELVVRSFIVFHLAEVTFAGATLVANCRYSRLKSLL